MRHYQLKSVYTVGTLYSILDVLSKATEIPRSELIDAIR
ncbi:ribbon-helix-helix domain-containing protein [Methanoculleus sp. UBA208]